MTQFEKVIQDLHVQLRESEAVSAKIRRAIEHLEALNGGSAAARPAATKTKAAKRRGPAPKVTKAAPKKASIRKSNGAGRPTMLQALRHVLEAHSQAGNSGGVSGKQLYSEVQKAGFKFGGTNTENNMHYLYKTLRKNDAFKRTGEGRYSLA